MLKKNFIWLIPIFLVSATGCEPEEEENNATVASPVAADPDLVVLSREQFETSSMELGKMQDRSFEASLKITGVVDVPPESRAEVSSYYGGYVRNLTLLTGQEVKKGERLFSLESPEFIQMQQDFLEAKSQLAYLASDYERQKTLRDENIASQKNFTRAESEYLSTLAKFEGLKKKLEQLHIDPNEIGPQNMVARIAVPSPISGFVTAVKAQNGAFLSPTDVAVSITNTDHLHLDLNVFEKDVSQLEKGQPIRFRLPDSPGQLYEAEVFLIGKTIDVEKRMLNVHAHFKDESQGGRFFPGMYVEAEIYSSHGISKALPAEAVVEGSGRHFVLVKKAEKPDEMVFEKKAVNIGASANGWTEILSAMDFEPDAVFLTKGAFNMIQ